MSTVGILTRRNLRIFFRDRAAVFFSLLSALILLGLYTLVLGALQVDSLTAQLPDASQGDIRWFVDSWVVAGITMITTLTTSLAALGVFVEDRTTGRFGDFMVSPLRRADLIGGYFVSSVIVSVTMTAFVVLVGQLYLVARGGGMSAGAIGQTLGFVVLSSAAFAALSSFGVTFVRTTAAFTALSTMVGTVVGFLAGAYIPVGSLPSAAQDVLGALPFAHAAMLLRGPWTADALDAMTSGPHQAEVSEQISAYYGITASVGSVDVTVAVACGALVVVLLLFTWLGALRLSRRIR